MSQPALSLEDALARMLAKLEPVAALDVPVDEALGHYLAQPLTAARTQPPADLSAMDGYAICGVGPWELIGESRCGQAFDGALVTGQTVRISTGAILPAGADRILIQENATVDGKQVAAEEIPPEGRHIRSKAFEFSDGDSLLEGGVRIGAAQLALARSAGRGSLSVTGRPKVTILDTGDELVADPTQCATHQIPASNAAMLSALAGQEPTTIVRNAPLPDHLDTIVEALQANRDADLIVITGGASVGDHDLAKPALEKAGAELDFWKVAMKPGKPLMVATRGQQLILGLPGNPVSSFVTGYLFMLPAIRRLAGASACLSRTIDLPLAKDCPAGGVRREFLRAAWTQDGLVPLVEQDSSALLALSRAEALIDRAAHADGTKAGTYVPAYWLGNGAIA
ncbi:molybdopterin molybdotransferase MoeA [Parerythrobacter jejuensis]|uniref:Molybdopterin molybdenumtransferase n=1 Tax=Parerythrobacter jejuensis TaxID=795812 RepID=A0A845ATT6_9SPHN|nr:molybdopterin molybdotransferase MoeA [Parerythrobacter jejuensis]MXP32435.1 molybdopterin molybdenumtransferase MoeA [Parerythrobacter jejuensis]